MKTSNYLPGLDGLRTVASLAVVIGHIELTKMNNGQDNYFAFIKNWGHLGVVLFFVLSGFLITTLLLKEKNQFNSISIKQFYMRRILRVWPLYFLVLLLSLFIFSYEPSGLTILLCSTIFPNIAHALQSGWAVSPQIWSIGVEEQFYLFWPSLLKLRLKTIIVVCILIVVGLPIAPHGIQFIAAKLGSTAETLRLIENIAEVLPFHAMATGALFSILLYTPNSKLLKLIHRIGKYALPIVLLPFVLWILNIHFGFFQISIYSILFATAMVFLINGFSNSLLESSLFKFLGKISYGTYMYHWIVMLLVFEMVQGTSIDGSLWLQPIIVGITLIVATLSFYYFERFFTRLKMRYERT